MYKNKRNVGAHDCFQKGITLIALVITIIVMLILVAVTISMAVNGGLFEYAGKAVGDTQNEIDAEQQLANGKIKVGNTWYDSIDDYLNNIPSGTQSGEITEGDNAGNETTGGEGTGDENTPVGTEEDPYEGQTADFTEEIGKVNSSDVIAYFYQKDNGKFDLVVRGEGAMKDNMMSMDCSGILSKYEVEVAYLTDGVTNIGSYAFKDNTNLTEITIPGSVTEIGLHLFYGCSDLASVTLKDGIEVIWESAFEGCPGLRSITIPESVVSIEDYAFYEDSLNTVYYSGTIAQWNKIEISEKQPYAGANYVPFKGATIICTDGSLQY